MPSRYLGASSTHYVYVVDTPGFSQFAVTAPTQSSNGGLSSSSAGTPSFSIVSTSIDRTDLVVGESVSVEAVVTNDGDAAGSFTARLTIDGAVVATQQVYLAPGESETVTFTRTFAQPGSYRVDIADTHVSSVRVTQPGTEVSDEDPDQRTGTDPGDPIGEDATPTEGPGGDSALDDPEQAIEDRSHDCEFFGYDFGRFVVCWYWWVLLLIVLTAFAAYWSRDRSRDEERWDDW